MKAFREGSGRGLVLAGCAVLAYLNALGASFQFDDFKVIVDNPAVHSLGAWARGMPGIRPLLKLSYAVGWTFAPSPWAFHGANVLLHACNVGLAYALLRRVCALTRLDEGAAVGGTLVFALHPLQTESVAYVCGRSQSLMALFFLGSLLAWFKGSRPWRLLSGLLFLLSFLSKETAVVLPLALALLEALKGPGRWRRLVIPGMLLLGLAAILALLPDYRRLLSFGWASRTPGDQLRSQVGGVAHLLGRFLWPRPLNIDPWLPVPPRWSALLALKGVLLLGLPLGALHCWKRWSWAAWGILWAFILLLPSQSLVPRLDVANERHMYLPVLGLGFAASGLALGLLPRGGPWRRGAAAALGALLAFNTWARNGDYRSERALWASSVAANPRNPRAFNNLGWAFHLEGREREARDAFREALRLDPAYPPALANLRLLEARSPERP
jgi:hypothetical protein